MMPLANPWSQHKTEQDKMSDLVALLAAYFESLLKQPDRTASRHSLFYSAKVPNISIQLYLKRFVKYLSLNDSDLIIMFSLIDKYTKKYQDYPLTNFNIHRLIAAAFQIGHKLHNDDCETSTIYARVAGVTRLEMNRLEKKLLFKLEFDLLLSQENYLEYKKVLIDFAKDYKGMLGCSEHDMLVRV